MKTRLAIRSQASAKFQSKARSQRKRIIPCIWAVLYVRGIKLACARHASVPHPIGRACALGARLTPPPGPRRVSIDIIAAAIISMVSINTNPRSRFAFCGADKRVWCRF